MKYLTSVEAAALWNMNHNSLLRLCRTGRIPGAIRVGRHWRIPEGVSKPKDGRRKTDGKTTGRKAGRPRQAILIVEDNEINREMLVAIFSGLYEIYQAEDGECALDILKKKQEGISLVLLDLVMPRMDGIELLTRMKAMGLMKTVPVIMITGQATEKLERQAYHLGVSDIIHKPFASDVVRQRAKNYIRMYDMQKRLHELEKTGATKMKNG